MGGRRWEEAEWNPPMSDARGSEQELTDHDIK
jgi:hypothetical protein